ncbi:hypothetical protein [Helicobacter rodentium]|uniref:hypothetical protein n=1 Tax=Helicobacter rodentium TaxID=59617 RepID=UPI0025A52E03|nr:hypothetical protein [Helicobacter rodentium]
MHCISNSPALSCKSTILNFKASTSSLRECVAFVAIYIFYLAIEYFLIDKIMDCFVRFTLSQ